MCQDSFSHKHSLRRYCHWLSFLSCHKKDSARWSTCPPGPSSWTRGALANFHIWQPVTVTSGYHSSGTVLQMELLSCKPSSCTKLSNGRELQGNAVVVNPERKTCSCRTTHVVAAWPSRHSDCVDVEVQPVKIASLQVPVSFVQARVSLVSAASVFRGTGTPSRDLLSATHRTSWWTASAIARAALACAADKALISH